MSVWGFLYLSKNLEHVYITLVYLCFTACLSVSMKLSLQDGVAKHRRKKRSFIEGMLEFKYLLPNPCKNANVQCYTVIRSETLTLSTADPNTTK